MFYCRKKSFKAKCNSSEKIHLSLKKLFFFVIRIVFNNNNNLNIIILLRLFRYAVILAFDVKIEREAQEMADREGTAISTHTAVNISLVNVLEYFEFHTFDIISYQP